MSSNPLGPKDFTTSCKLRCILHQLHSMIKLWRCIGNCNGFVRSKLDFMTQCTGLPCEIFLVLGRRIVRQNRWRVTSSYGGTDTGDSVARHGLFIVQKSSWLVRRRQSDVKEHLPYICGLTSSRRRLMPPCVVLFCYATSAAAAWPTQKQTQAKTYLNWDNTTRKIFIRLFYS